MGEGLVEDALRVLVALAGEAKVLDHELFDFLAGAGSDGAVGGGEFGQHGEGADEEDHL